MAGHNGDVDGNTMGQRPQRVRPRRLETDTLSYLKEVTEVLTNPIDGTTNEDKHLLLWNVLEEVAPRTASAASDRHGGALLEILLPHLNNSQLRYFFHKLLGYVSHLWTNRYSSHVLQNALSRCSATISTEDAMDDSISNNNSEGENDADDDRMNGIPLLSDLIISMVKEVEAEWITLMNDISASHVMRSIFSVLSGRPLISDKRGKKGKHRAVSFGETKSGEDLRQVYSVPDSFTSLFGELISAILSCPWEQLMNLVYDQNSGPVVATALKVASKETQLSLSQHLLQWSDEERSVSLFYDYAGASIPSHILESIMESSSDDFFLQVVQRCLLGKLLEFSQHEIANYVVQNVIQRLIQCKATKLFKQIADELISELEPTIWTLLSAGRPGVVSWLVTICEKFPSRQEKIYQSLVVAVEKREMAKPKAAQKDFVAALLALELPTSGNKKCQLNVMGAKIIFALMKFGCPDWLMPLYKYILQMNSAQLLALAKDSTGSRYIIEPIWENVDDKMKDIQLQLFNKFLGEWANLATDRLGAFSVLKCYEKLDIPEKECIVKELLKHENQIMGSHFAQLVINTCQLQDYKTDKNKWRAGFEKKNKLQKMFEAVVDMENDNTIESVTMKDNKHKKEKKSDEKKEKKRKKKTSESKNNLMNQDEDVEFILSALENQRKSKKSKRA